MDRPQKTEVSVVGENGTVVANLDLERPGRCGAPEAVFAAGKAPRDTVAIAAAMAGEQGRALVTRADAETLAALRARWPGARMSEHGGTVLIGVPAEPGSVPGSVCIVTAGTSDLGVAEEAALTLEALGAKHSLVADAGVAGIHRLFKRLGAIRAADVVIAVAGMEGALPSVIAGLVDAPVIATPTSVGYGMSLAGLSALMGMLNTCSPGIAVVNIDNGFGAAVLAARMLAIGGRAGRDS